MNRRFTFEPVSNWDLPMPMSVQTANMVTPGAIRPTAAGERPDRRRNFDSDFLTETRDEWRQSVLADLRETRNLNAALQAALATYTTYYRQMQAAARTNNYYEYEFLKQVVAWWKDQIKKLSLTISHYAHQMQ